MLKTVKTEGKEIVLRGIGKMFFEGGIPLQISITGCLKKGLTVSYLHVADDLLKNNMSSDTVINRVETTFSDCGVSINKDMLVLFCNSTYEQQREIIFTYLWGCRWDDVRSGKNKKPLQILNDMI